jgi:RNA polymerase sigma-70 factor, ECF subfamily
MATCVMTSMARPVSPADKQTRWQKPERNLIQRAQSGDEQAFAELFQLHKKRVYSVCLLMTKDVAEAEDLTQEAFLQVFRTIGTFRGESAFSTWLYRIAVNTVLMKLRRQKSKAAFSLSEPVSQDSPNLAHDLGERDIRLSGTIDRIALLRAIEALPEGCRTVFMLHEVEGYQHHEIAALLNCSIGNSKSQLHKAKLKMRDLLFPKRRILRRRVPAPAPRERTVGDRTVNEMLSVHSGATDITGLLPALLTPMVAQGRVE